MKFIKRLRYYRKPILFTSLTLIVLFGSIAALLALNPRGSEAAWFNDAYSYRQLFSFTHNADISTPRAVTFSLDTAELITAGLMQSDCDDTRFTDLNGKELQFELTGSCNNSATTYEVVFPTVVNGTNSAYVYYGNAAATTGSRSVTGITALTPSGGDPSITDRAVEEKGQSPVGYWSFDEGYGSTAQDSSQNNNDATISGASWKPEDMCVSGKCLFFDGSDDVATVTNASSIDLNEGLAAANSFSVWVKPNSDGENDTGQIFQKGTSTYLRVDSQSGSSLDVEASLDLATADATVNVSAGIIANQWNQITVVYTDDGDDEIDVYINGKLAGTSTNGSGAPAAESSNLLIGGTTTANFHGFIDEPKIYNYARSEAQIKSDFTARGTNEGTSASLGGTNQKAVSDGLVGYWNLDEPSWTNNCSTTSIFDLSGNGSNGISCGNGTGPTGGSLGKFGNSGTFGSGNYTQFTHSNAHLFSQALTISAWVKSSTTGQENTGIVGKWHSQGGNNESTFVLGVGSPADKPFMSLRNTSDSQVNVSGTTSVNNGSWNHILTTYDGATIKMYVNGVLEGTSNQTGTVKQGTGTLQIGSYSSGFTYTGSVDEVRMYNRTLSPAEIISLYNFAPGPVGHWKLDEATSTTANDSSGNDNAATLTNSPSWTIGKYGNAVTFAGSNQHITRADDSDFDFGDDVSFSFETFMKHGTASAQEIILSKYNEAGYKMIMESDGDITCALDYDSTWSPTDSASSTAATYDDNNWHHVACVKDSASTLNLYIDGVLIATDSSLTATNTVTNSDPLYIGIDADGSSNDWTGQLDDVKIYNYARTSKQIVEDMNGGHPLIGTPIAGAAGHWSFDEGSGTTANDQTPNDNDLTLNTASWTTSGKYDKAWNGTGATWLSRSSDDDFDIPAGGDLTVSMWVKSDSTSNPSSVEYILNKNQIGVTDEGYKIYVNSTGGFIGGGIDDDGASFPEDSVLSTTDLYDATWHHIVMVKSGTSRLDLYVDGKLNHSDTSISTTGAMASGNTLVLGDLTGSNDGDEFNGDIDELKIYRAALSADDVKVEYTQGKAQVFGSFSTESDGTTASNSSARAYCVPGDTSTCDAPIGIWNFDEASGSAQDGSGNANTGTPFNATRVLGKVGNAINFTDDDGEINLGSGTTLDNPTAISFSGWIYPESMGELTLGRIIGKGTAADETNGWMLEMNGSGGASSYGLNFKADFTSTNLHRATEDNVITQNAWNHVAVTWDGSGTATNVHIYVNGKEVTSYSATTNGTNGLVASPALSTAASSMRIGNEVNGSRGFDGKVDNFVFYNYVRTSAQVAWDYNRGGPLGWWQFDECQGTTAYDASGNGFNGTLTPGASGNTAAGTCTSGDSAHMWADGATGKFNASLGFDGTDDYVDVNNASIFQITGPLSLSGWVNTSSSGNRSIITKWGSSGQFGYRLYIDTNGKANFLISSNGSGTNTVTSNKTLSNGTWHHVVGVFTGSGIQLYVDGKLDNTAASATSVFNSSANLQIGTNSSGANLMSGLIDDVRIYNYPLTSAQVKTIMNDNSAVRFGPTSGQP